MVLEMIAARQGQADRKAAYRARIAAAAAAARGEMSPGSPVVVPRESHGTANRVDREGEGREGKGRELREEASADADALFPPEAGNPPHGVSKKAMNGHGYRPPDCPHAKIVALWADILPGMPQPLGWRGQRAEHLRTRWREMAVEQHWPNEEAGLKFFAKLFRWVGKSQFLTGKAKRKGDERTFTAELPWVVRPENFLKVIEGKYHDED